MQKTSRCPPARKASPIASRSMVKKPDSPQMMSVVAGLGLCLPALSTRPVIHYMADQLYQVRSYDPVSLAIAIVVLSASAAIAGFIPARRAANIEPMTALRTE